MIIPTQIAIAKSINMRVKIGQLQVKQDIIKQFISNINEERIIQSAIKEILIINKIRIIIHIQINEIVRQIKNIESINKIKI